MVDGSAGSSRPDPAPFPLLPDVAARRLVRLATRSLQAAGAHLVLRAGEGWYVAAADGCTPAAHPPAEHSASRPSEPNAAPSSNTPPLPTSPDAFTRAVLMHAGELQVEDVRTDPRFADSPLAEGPIRFAAGQPLRWNDGPCVGALCVFDAAARTPSDDDAAALADVAETVLQELNPRDHGTPEDVSEAQAAREALRRSHERWQRLVVAHRDPIQITVNGVIRYVNPAGALLFGADSPGAVIGRPVTDFVADEAVADELRARRDALNRGESTAPLEHELVRLDGKRRIIESYSVPIQYEGQRAAQTVLRDVTERRWAEDRLRAQERQYRELVQSTSAIFWRADPDTFRFRFVSREAEFLLGYDRSRWVDEPDFWQSHLHPEDRDWVPEHAIRTAAEEERYTFDYRMQAKDGQTVWMRHIVNVIKDGGTPVELAGVMIDVTDQKEAERALQEERDRLATLFESLPVPVVHGIPDDDAFIVLTANSAFERIFGVGADVLRGEDLHRWIVPEDRWEEAVGVNRRLSRDAHIRTEVRRQTERGLRDFRVQAVVRTPETGPPEAYAIYTDITEAKRRETELVRAKEKAEEGNRMKSAFLANMSHEIRTPLTSVIGFAEAIESEIHALTGEANASDAGNVDGEASSASRVASGGVSERATGSPPEERDEADTSDLAVVGRFAALIGKSGRRLLEMLNGILNLSKLEAGEMDLRAEPVDLTAEVNEAVALFTPEAEAADLTLHTDTVHGPVQAAADPDGVRIILRNLVSNAIKYTDPGGEVWVRARTEVRMTVLEVEDTGIGMEADSVQDLFDAFRQASEGMARKYEGSGLGLAVTKEAVEQMNGTIAVHTRRGHGTRFTVRLPRGRGAWGQPGSP